MSSSPSVAARTTASTGATRARTTEVGRDGVDHGPGVGLPLHGLPAGLLHEWRLGLATTHGSNDQRMHDRPLAAEVDVNGLGRNAGPRGYGGDGGRPAAGREQRPGRVQNGRACCLGLDLAARGPVAPFWLDVVDHLDTV